MTTPIHKTILHLILIQGGNYLVPLLLLPYLGRVLGVTEFGVLAFCQAVTQYFFLLTDYGYNLTATRHVSLQRHDARALSATFSATTGARLTLCAMSLAILLTAVAVWPTLASHWRVMAAAFVGVIGNTLMPTWLFQGLERVQLMVVPTFISRLVSLACVVLLVHGEGDAAKAALGISIGQLGLAGSAWWIIYRARLTAWIAVPFKAVFATLKDGFWIFLSFALLNFYSNLNTILLNHFHGPDVVAQFAIAEKVRIACFAVVALVGQGFYPRISQQHAADPAAARALMRRAILTVLAAAVGLQVVLMVGAGWAIDLWLGERFRESIFLLRCELLMLPVSAMGFVFCELGLYVQGRTNTIRNVYVGATLAHLVYVVPLTRHWGAAGTVFAMIATESICASLFAWLYFREVRRSRAQLSLQTTS